MKYFINKITGITSVLPPPFIIVALIFQLFWSTASLSAPFNVTDLSQAEIIKHGERMYREGLLPSGNLMDAYIRGDVAVDSSAFSCSSCHLRAGLGSFEGGVITPPTTGKKLYGPYRRPPSLGDTADQAGRFIYAKTVQERPAYNRETLATAMRFGTDPAGQVFNDVMPRYPLSDRDMSILISYLESLSSEPSPGATSSEFRFATIITDDVSPEDRQALLLPLQTFISQKNQQMAMYTDFIKFGYSPTIDMKHAFRKASLEIWELKGQQETWQKQLTDYYNSKPVFAVLGGISNKDWRPIHNFCESQRLPCLFPITDFPVTTESGWYTYYYNRGYIQEGEAVAGYLNRLDRTSSDGIILQIIQDSPVGRSLSEGFMSSWADAGRPAVQSVTLTQKQLQDSHTLDKLLDIHKPSVILLWADQGLLNKLEGLAAKLPSSGMIFLSSTYFGKKSASIPENVRSKAYLSYPYRLDPYLGPKTGGFDAKVPILSNSSDFGDRRITSRMQTALQQVILQALNLIYDNLYQDHLLDVMGMQMDVTARDYERLSFGPGQRFASKGCYIIQLGPGSNPALLKRSDWINR